MFTIIKTNCTTKRTCFFLESRKFHGQAIKIRQAAHGWLNKMGEEFDI